MSSTIYVSAIDLEDLRHVPGSGDAALLQQLLESQGERLEQHDRYFSSWSGAGQATSLAEALRQIVFGCIDPQLMPRFLFEHAAALLADALGEPLDASEFEECSPDLRDEVDEIITRCLVQGGLAPSAWPSLHSVLSRGPALDVPLDARWRLGSGYLEAAEVVTAIAAAQACKVGSITVLLNDLRWPDEALSAAVQYSAWLQHASTLRLGLYLHL